MTTKVRLPQMIKFFASSRRVIDTCRVVAKKNKYLTSCSSIVDLNRIRLPQSDDEAGQSAVILSHIEDDYLLLKKAEVKPVSDRAFHFLFTEATTHPDQVAHWMRETKIQAESRLHVCELDKFDAPQLSMLLGRICSALGENPKRGGIIDAYIFTDTLFVRGQKHRMLHVPLRAIKSLHGQPQDVTHNFRIDPDGSFLHWPIPDVHLGWYQFLQAVDPAELLRAQQQSEAFNQRYGAAIRKLREEAGISQSMIPSFTDRQIRRIEQGARATSKVLVAFAQAHGIDTNTYLERVAKAMEQRY